MNQNYQKIMEEITGRIKTSGQVPSLLLHSCCAPCSSYVLEYLSGLFRITVFYYNPNIQPSDEYRKRAEEQKRFLTVFPAAHPVSFAQGPYDESSFLQIAAGLEEEKEGGRRCFRCYELRLRRAAEYAKKHALDYFTTTLSVSPYKNAQKLNEIGGRLASEYGVPYLYSDFKKKNGYLRSLALSAQYGLYRQNYCGCRFSRRERDRRAGGSSPDSAGGSAGS